MNYYKYNFKTFETDGKTLIFNMNSNRDAFKYFLIVFRNNEYSRNQIAVDNFKTIIGAKRTEKIMKYIKGFYGGLLKLEEEYLMDTDEDIYYGYVFGLRN